MILQMLFMDFKIEKLIKNRISSSYNTIQKLIENCCLDISNGTDIIKTSLINNGKIFWCGNGGSASQAQHFSTEIIGGMNRHDLNPKPSICLNADSTFLTAWSNDVGYDFIFSRQLQGIASKNDVLVSISTSGNSKNIINAILEAKKIGMKTIAMTGKNGGDIKNLSDIVIKVPSNNTQNIQESHLVIGHIICEIIENFSIEKR